MATATEEITEVPDKPPVSTMANWLDGMSEIGKMVKAPVEPAPDPAAGKKEADDGKTGSTDAGTVAPPKVPAAGAAPDAGAPTAGAAQTETVPAAAKSGEGDTGEEKWPRSKKDWDLFKENRKKSEEALRSQIAEREAKIKEFEAKMQEAAAKPAAQVDPNIKAKLDALEAENKELTEKITVLDVTQHPEFKAYFDNKTKAQVELAKRIVGSDKSDQLSRILDMPDSEYKSAQLDEFMGDLTTAQLSRFGGVLNALDSIKAEKEQEIAKAAEHKQKLQADQAQKAEMGSKQREKWFTDTLTAVQGAKEIDLFRPKDGDAAWNAKLNERVNKAKEIFLGKSNPAEVAAAALFAASLPVLKERHDNDLRERDEKISKLEAQVKALTAAQPSGGKGTGAAAPGADKNETSSLKEGMSPHEAGSAFVRSMHDMLKTE